MSQMYLTENFVLGVSFPVNKISAIKKPSNSALWRVSSSVIPSKFGRISPSSPLVVYLFMALIFNKVIEIRQLLQIYLWFMIYDLC